MMYYCALLVLIALCSSLYAANHYASLPRQFSTPSVSPLNFQGKQRRSFSPNENMSSPRSSSGSQQASTGNDRKPKHHGIAPCERYYIFHNCRFGSECTFIHDDPERISRYNRNVFWNYKGGNGLQSKFVVGTPPHKLVLVPYAIVMMLLQCGIAPTIIPILGVDALDFSLSELPTFPNDLTDDDVRSIIILFSLGPEILDAGRQMTRRMSSKITGQLSRWTLSLIDASHQLDSKFPGKKYSQLLLKTHQSRKDLRHGSSNLPASISMTVAPEWSPSSGATSSSSPTSNDMSQSAPTETFSTALLADDATIGSLDLSDSSESATCLMTHKAADLNRWDVSDSHTPWQDVDWSFSPSERENYAKSPTAAFHHICDSVNAPAHTCATEIGESKEEAFVSSQSSLTTQASEFARASTPPSSSVVGPMTNYSYEQLLWQRQMDLIQMQQLQINRNLEILQAIHRAVVAQSEATFVMTQPPQHASTGHCINPRPHSPHSSVPRLRSSHGHPPIAPKQSTGSK